jgi:AraC-like DNA-binding protein
MGIIATLMSNPVQLQRLRQAVRDRHTLIECDGWVELMRTCAAEPVHLAVLDLYASGSVDFENVRQLKSSYPRVSLVAYVAAAPERGRDLFDAGRCGVDGLVMFDQDDDPQALLALINQAEARSIATIVRRAIVDAPRLVRDAVLVSIVRAHERLTPASLSRILLVSRRLLAQRLAESRLPPPQRLLTWGRLVVAAHLLEDPARSADGVALALGFPSGSAFRNVCQRYLHATPSQIRSRGGAAYVIRALLRPTKATPLPTGTVRRSPTRAPHLMV